jgi:hypothetical protein
VLDEDLGRNRFDQLRKAYVANDGEADDSIDESSRFAAFVGPDRTEAVAHWNIMSLFDAATDIESTPVPPPLPKILPNKDADALFLLAQLSADAPRATSPKPHQDAVAPPPSDLQRASSPADILLPLENALASEPGYISEGPQYEQHTRKETPLQPETNAVHHTKESDPPKNETPARSTHRIMDMLNNDAEVPVPKSRGAREQTPVATSSRRFSTTQTTPTERNLPGLESMVYPPPNRASSGFQASSLPPHSAAPVVSPSSNQHAPDWAPKLPSYLTGMSEESLRRRDPLNAIRAMLDVKALAEGRIPRSMRAENPDNARKSAADRERAHIVAPPPSRPLSPTGTHGSQDTAGKDAQRPSAGGYTQSPSTQPLSYTQSPTNAPSHPLSHHGSRTSQDATSSQWGRRRSHSGSQAPQSYANSPPQPYQPEPHRTNAPPHQSSTSAPQLPSISAALPPKPPGPPPSNPINFRFAHYDPAPPRPPVYPSSNAAPYPATSYPPHYGPPPPSRYGGPTSYSGPPSYHSGYVPPPGSFQAPPPPTSAMSPYPPLKIHQYGGQPILPANMAPPPVHSQPPAPYMSQPPSQGGYSPSQQHEMPSRSSSYDQGSSSSRDAQERDRSSESQHRQRRQYRSYHAPGTQFRSYQGPESGRRRG